MLLVDDARLDERRALVAPGGPLASLFDSLAGELEPLLGREPRVPREKALLSRAGGRCERCGGALAFDPWSPDRHRCDACRAGYSGPLHHRAWIMPYQLWLAERALQAALFHLLRGRDAHAAFARDALRIPIATERSGRDFYTRAAKITRDARARSVFLKLSEEEVDHLGRLERRYRELLAQDAELEARPTFLFFKGAANGLFSEGTERLSRGVNDQQAYLIGIRCERGSQLRPHVVWFGEAVTEFPKAKKMVEQADLFLVVGTSLSVYPAAGVAIPRQRRPLVTAVPV